jgi:hypothetical protein
LKLYQSLWSKEPFSDMRIPLWPLWVARRHFSVSHIREAKKAVVFDLGGVILPSPFAAAAGDYAVAGVLENLIVS